MRPVSAIAAGLFALIGALQLVRFIMGWEATVNGIAIPVWAIALPFSLVLGHGMFMSPLVRLFNHLGRLLAFLGINPVGEPYVMN